MKIEDQVCSLELAKKLHKLKVNQEDALYYWGKAGMMGWQLENRNYANYRWKRAEIHAAFTVAELGEMLPRNLYGFNPVVSLLPDGVYQCGYLDNERKETHVLNGWKQADTEADARAKMLIYLIKNKLITPRGDNI